MKHVTRIMLLTLGFGASLASLPAAAETTVKDLAEQSVAVTTAVAASGTPPVIQLAPPPAVDPAAAQGKIPDQVQSAMKKLEQGKVDLSLEDMNQARAALARLDLLLELEQKMHDLEKARAKRDESADMAGDVSAMLPPGVARMPRGAPIQRTAALAMPAADLGAPPPRRAARPAVASDYEVKRIMGAGGRYSAMLETPDARQITVRVGDTLDDGAEVKVISATAVKIKYPNEKKDHNLRITNAGAISNGRKTP